MKVKPIDLNQLKEYKCLFFDFDGVVLESANIKTEAFVELYRGTGIEEEIRAHHLAHQGVSRYEKFRWISENLLNKEHSEVEGNELADRFSDLVKSKVLSASFVPGFEDMIEFVRKQSIYCVVASGTPEDELRDIVTSRQLSGFFDEVYGSPKTKSEIVNDVIGRKGFARNECLFFGDASTDHLASIDTGVDFYARLTRELVDYWNSVDYKFGAPDFLNLD